jgi:hypothetical protein
VTKYLIFATCLVIGCGGLNAQQTAWRPSPGHPQVPIWPGAVPDAQPVARREVANAENKSLVAGRPWVGVGQVTRPTMTVYSPEGKNAGPAVVVFPGGGYQILAIDLEGTKDFELNPYIPVSSQTPAYLPAASGGRPGEHCKDAGLLHCAEAGWGSGGDAFVCPRWSRFWPPISINWGHPELLQASGTPREMARSGDAVRASLFLAKRWAHRSQ